MGKEFLNINGNVKEKLIRVTGNVEILENYLGNKDNRKKLSSNEIAHLEHRIKIMKELNAIAEQNRKEINKRKALIAPIEREDGTLELVHIHQDKVQSTFNGCWSVSLQLLLQSRGIQLTQEQIRGFRPNFIDDSEVKELENEETFNHDKKATMEDKVDLVMKLLPNTSLNEMEISSDPNKRQYNIDMFKKIVTMALKEDNSPVSMVTNGHFCTIVGINGNELLLKDSIQFRTHGANHTYRVSIEDIVKKHDANLYWLHDLKLEKDGSCAEFSGNDVISYKNGELKVDKSNSVRGKQYKEKMEKVNRPLSADIRGDNNWTRDANSFGVENRKFKNMVGDYGAYIMKLPKKMHPAEPRKIRKYTEAEIELIDRLKEREVLEDIQMKLSIPNKNGLYPVMTEKDLQELNMAYEKVSNMYDEILKDEKVKISEKQKEYLIELKGRVDKEKQIFLKIQNNKDGVLPTYREALREGMRKLEGPVQTRYEEKIQSLQSLQAKFEGLDKKGHRNSKEYTEMVNSAKKLQLIVEAISNPNKWKDLGISPAPNEHEIYQLLKKTEAEAVKAVDTYITEKGNPHTAFGKNRLVVAKELKAELSKSMSTFLEETQNRLQEERMDEIMKEQARLKEELSKIKPAFPSDELKVNLAKFESGTQMYDVGNRALVALETLNGMKYQKDINKIEPDKKRLQDSIAKVMAFTILSERKFQNPETKNTFSIKYFNALTEALKNTKVLNNSSLEQWFDVLEKKEGAPTLQQICAEFSEKDLLSQNILKTQVKNDKKIETAVKNQYMIYSPTKINFDEQNSAGISDYVKNMNAVKDAKYDIKVPENLDLNNKEVALLTLLQLATMNVGTHYRDAMTSDDKKRMLNGVAWSVENTFAERDADEKNLGALIDKEREALSNILKKLAEGNKEPMQNFMKEALDNFKIALLPEQGLTERARFAAKIGSDIFELLEKHPSFLPETMNPEHIKTYKAFKECSQLVEEAAQARKDLATIDYNNLNDPSVKEKLEDAMAKIIAENVINAEIIKDYAGQNKKIESEQEKLAEKVREEMNKAQQNFKVGPEYKAENDKVMQSYMQKLNNINSIKLEMLKAPKILMDLNLNTKQELLQRVKNTAVFKSIINDIYQNTNKREALILDTKEFLKQTTDKMVEKCFDITKNLSTPAKELQAKKEAVVKTQETGPVIG